jgi:serine phosphatase RsbU (regulator of sigma subunit)
MHLTSVSDSRFPRYGSVDEQSAHLGDEQSPSLDRFERFFPEPLPFEGLTTLPSHPRLRFGLFHRAGRRAAVDYLDVLNLGANRFAIAMATVSGPGASAAAAMLETTVRGHAGRHADSGSLLHHIDQYFHNLRNEAVLATGISAVIDTRRRTLQLACAGHPAPLLARQGAGVTSLRLHRTMPLGNIGLILTSEFELCRGDRLLFYTDGATNRDSAERVRYDVDRLTSALQETRELSVAGAVDCLANEIERFAGGHEPDDDQTLLMVAFGGSQ